MTFRQDRRNALATGAASCVPIRTRTSISAGTATTMTMIGPSVPTR